MHGLSIYELKRICHPIQFFTILHEVFTAVDTIRNVNANDGQGSTFYSDHASSHKCGVRKAYLASKRVVVVNHPP